MEKMTTKDIRDIAAYWGSPCTFEYEPELAEDIDTFYSETVNHRILGALFRNPHRENKFTDIKLQLRTISSLTDEEKWHCAQLAGHENRDTHYFVISDTDDLLFYDNVGMPSPVYNPGAIVAYLQSIHVYVPGTIDEKYVNLVE